MTLRTDAFPGGDVSGYIHNRQPRGNEGLTAESQVVLGRDALRAAELYEVAARLSKVVGADTTGFTFAVDDGGVKAEDRAREPAFEGV